ncbi:MAG TPA: carbon-nitrogen hydrolase family protein [Dehalococcoidia bacterium]|nr:carbon-nitrogen hydrolase family protein [Dehalococcoidia bacterium]
MEDTGYVGTLKVAGVQMEPRLLDREENLARCLESMQIAAREGARLIVFPECALTGYMYSSLDEAMPVFETVPGTSTEMLIAACRDLNVYVVVGLLERDIDDCYNTAALLGPWGVLAKYRKLHLPHLGIDRFINPGNMPIEVCETEIGRLGLGICYDARFPEHARVLTLKGADILVLIANWPEPSIVFPQFIIPTRAIENHVFCVAVNRVGEEGGERFIGRSAILNCHMGEPLAVAGEDEEEIIYAEIEPAEARNKHIVFELGRYELDLDKDRRPELYEIISEHTVEEPPAWE